MMRLTLRTLIAWLDDKLTPSEVRTIGQQVAESPFAKELVERVQRVTRQRRLSYPGDLGTEPVDPNIVAAYLDNELNPEQVADYEKRCLTSDVHLAEVASVHQVLSLIGQKAKVPADAKLRMYRLVRGREATKPEPEPRPAARPGSKPSANPPTPPKAPVTEPIAAWSGPAPNRRSWLERFGPAAAVLGMIGVLVWTAIYSLSLPDRPAQVADNRKPDVQQPPAQPVAPVETPKVADENPPPEVAPKPEPPKPEPKPEPGVAGAFDEVRGAVLRADAAGDGWDRVEAKGPLKDKARLLNLAPFRNTLKCGTAEVDLVDSTDVVLDAADADSPAGLALRRGLVVVRPSAGSGPFPLRFEGQVLAISTQPGGVVGVERLPAVLPGQAEPAPARLRIFVPEGKVVLKAGEAEQVVEGPGEVSFLLSGRFTEARRQPMPPWVGEASPSTFSKEVGDQFAAFLRPGRTILADLAEAMDDPQKDVKRMAVQALGAIGAMDQVVEVVSRKEEATVHRAAIDVLRGGLAQGGETAKAVREALVRKFDDPWAAVTEKLLIGYPPEAARDEKAVIELVDYLATAPSRGTRELALDNLRTLTGRDNLEYDPDNPEGKGLKAWQDLVRSKRDASKGTPPR